MFAYIEGVVADINPAYAVLDCGGVGYEIRISLNTYSQIKDSSKTKLWVHPIIRDDAHLLYGFSTMDEKRLFLHLISVSGVGANTACMILSALSPAETIQTIIQGDARKIQSVKGIGTKTAQRIIVDLKDKVGKDVGSIGITAMEDVYPQRESALNALVMLGFAKTASEKVVDKVLLSQPELDIEGIIKQALRML